MRASVHFAPSLHVRRSTPTLKREAFMKKLFFLALLLIVNITFAQEAPSDVTEAQVLIYQLGMDTGCKHAGRRRGDPTDKVDAFCNCVMKTLKDNASQAEWQQAYYFSQKRQDREEAQALASHMPRIKACKQNAL